MHVILSGCWCPSCGVIVYCIVVDVSFLQQGQYNSVLHRIIISPRSSPATNKTATRRQKNKMGEMMIMMTMMEKAAAKQVSMSFERNSKITWSCPRTCTVIGQQHAFRLLLNRAVSERTGWITVCKNKGNSNQQGALLSNMYHYQQAPVPRQRVMT